MLLDTKTGFEKLVRNTGGANMDNARGFTDPRNVIEIGTPSTGNYEYEFRAVLRFTPGPRLQELSEQNSIRNMSRVVLDVEQDRQTDAPLGPLWEPDERSQGASRFVKSGK